MLKCTSTFLSFLLLLSISLAGCNNDPETDKAQNSDEDNGTLSPSPNNGGIELPSGFVAKVVADDLGTARHIAIRDNGDIYIGLRQKENGHGSVALRDTTGNGEADIREYFGDFAGTGAAIRNGYLYRTSTTAVYRYPLKDGQLKPEVDKRETIVKGFPDQSSHAAKPIDFDAQGSLYINVGAPSNACMEESRTKGSPGQDPCPLLEKHGGIWKYDADQTGQTHSPGNRYATGMRNIVALDWNDQVNSLYLVQHGRDQLNQFFPDLYDKEASSKLPAEEFHKVNQGDNLGWPYCYYDQMKGKKVLGPEYGGDGEKVGRCDQYKDPLIGFPGHWAPNDLKFYESDHFPGKYQNGAFIAWHGSWNRHPVQKGYNVTFVPFDGDKPTGKDDWSRFADGFKGKEELKSPRNAEYRPMGLAVGPDGHLYITDSQSGRVWRVWHQDNG